MPSRLSTGIASFILRAKGVLSPHALRLIGPILIEQTLLMTMSVINSMLASHIGTNAVSAVSMVDSMNNLVIAFFSALAVGATVVVAQFSGRKDMVNANETVKQAMYSSLGLIVGVSALLLALHGPLLTLLYGNADADVLAKAQIYFVGSVLSYPFIAISGISNGILRGSGDTRTPMLVTLLMNIVTLTLGYTLIYGIPVGEGRVIGAIGITGAVASIAAARATGAIILLVVLLRGNRSVRLMQPFKFQLNMGIQKSLFGIGLPASVENILFNTGKLLTQTLLVSCGTIAVAATFYMNSVFNLMNLPGNAMNLATTTIIGQNMGAGDTREARSNMLNMVMLSCLILVVICALSYPFAPMLVGIFNPEESVLPMAVMLVRACCIALPFFWSPSFIFPAGLRATGDGKYCMIVSMISMWVFRVGGAYVFTSPLFNLGALGLVLAMFADWIVRGSFFVRRVLSNKWMQHVVLKT